MSGRVPARGRPHQSRRTDPSDNGAAVGLTAPRANDEAQGKCVGSRPHCLRCVWLQAVSVFYASSLSAAGGCGLRCVCLSADYLGE